MKRIVACCMVLLVSLTLKAQLYTDVVNYKATGTPVYGVKIKTNFPFVNGSQMPSIHFQGYSYGSSEPIDLTLVYYVWDNTFIHQCLSSAGAYTPPMKLANENGKVSIFIDSKSYFQRFNVHVDAGGLAGENASNLAGWTAVDSNLISSASAVTQVAYVNRFSGTVYLPNGKVDSASTRIESDGDAVSYANMMLGVKTTTSLGTTAPMLYNLSLRKDGLFSGNTTAPTLELYALRKNGTFIAPFLVMPDGTVVLAGAQNAVNGNVGIGVRDTKGYKLAVGGNMIAEKVVVKLQASWPDYVFAPHYKLPTLKELEAYLEREKHLPGFASAKEVEENGVDLAATAKALTKQVEELTLYIIQQQKELETLKELVKKSACN
ncbi:hypothetical protein [Chitinophaga pinensis]|uniref:Tail fiber domain-containing protein n=1 Tax=Chitinophaga pinensis (strain ATCC 43595 / DSM 2588 / LMG 13176 / NBRC 15968 / NCIMB 11800 / UQM 2034) TaxID=485918 RepID=A0A979G4H7_CHIPD|nr:hypothetical protein [Chitinophaga pinensis]ACU60654.1 hypothetical protein Cpin_3187 [Chitinophaga pinensis DSM 2588]